MSNMTADMSKRMDDITIQFAQAGSNLSTFDFYFENVNAKENFTMSRTRGLGSSFILSHKDLGVLGSSSPQPYLGDSRGSWSNQTTDSPNNDFYIRFVGSDALDYYSNGVVFSESGLMIPHLGSIGGTFYKGNTTYTTVQINYEDNPRQYPFPESLGENSLGSPLFTQLYMSVSMMGALHAGSPFPYTNTVGVTTGSDVFPFLGNAGSEGQYNLNIIDGSVYLKRLRIFYS